MSYETLEDLYKREKILRKILTANLLDVILLTVDKKYWLKTCQNSINCFITFIPPRYKCMLLK